MPFYKMYSIILLMTRVFGYLSPSLLLYKMYILVRDGEIFALCDYWRILSYFNCCKHCILFRKLLDNLFSIFSRILKQPSISHYLVIFILLILCLMMSPSTLDLIGNSHFWRSRNIGSHDYRTINDIVRNGYMMITVWPLLSIYLTSGVMIFFHMLFCIISIWHDVLNLNT